MLKKIISLMIVFQFAMAPAFAGTSDLKSAFDEFSYSLTVEWDQQDPAFAEDALHAFRSQIATASDKELEDLFTSLLKGREHEARLFVQKMRSGDLNKEQALRELQNLSGMAYQEGASFVPVKNIVIGVVGGAAVIFLAGLLIFELSGDPDIFGDEGWK